MVTMSRGNLFHLLKCKDWIGHVKYWKAQCEETRLLRLERGKGCKALPIVIEHRGREVIYENGGSFITGNPPPKDELERA